MTEQELSDLLSRSHCRVAGNLSGAVQQRIIKESLTVAEPKKAAKIAKKSSGPNKTEAAYGRVLGLEFPGAAIRYEALTLQLDNGHAYRPDWVVTLATGEILCVEVKNGAYKHASYGRSKMAYDQAKIDWPVFRFRWAELHQGVWKIKD